MKNVFSFIGKLKYSLGARLILIILAIFVFFALFLMIINIVSFWKKSSNSFTNNADYVANFTASSNSTNAWNLDYANLKKYIESLLMEKSLIAVIFELEIDAGNENLMRFYGVSKGKLIDSMATRVADVAPDTESYSLYLERPINYQNAKIGKVHLYFSDEFIVLEAVRQIKLILMNLAIFIVFFTLLLITALKRALLTPLAQIHRMALGVSSFTTYLSESVSQEKWQHVHNLLMVERENQNRFKKDIRNDELGDFISAFLLVLNGFEVVVSELAQYSAQLQLMNDELEGRIFQRTAELEASNKKSIEALDALQKTQGQLIQQEKLASIGQLAAGVAHEINNPIGYVGSNINRLGEYFEDLQGVIGEIERHLKTLPAEIYQPLSNSLSAIKKRIDFEFILEDFSLVIADCREGIVRVKDIVQSLKDFSHGVDDREFTEVDINEAINTTLKVVNNEIKYHCDTHLDLQLKERVPANIGQIHQVVSNIVVNAAHAMRETGKHGQLGIRTYSKDGMAIIEIQDTGGGIPPEAQPKVFDPFFTTKPIGQGTGLGLNICYDIIVNKHAGSLHFETESGVGTKFIVRLPIHREAGVTN